MKLRAKLALGFTAVIFIVIVLGVTSYVMFKRVDGNVVILAERALPELRSAATIEESLLKTLVLEKQYLLSRTDDALKQIKEQGKIVIENLGDLSRLAANGKDTELSSLVAELQKLFGEYAQLFDQTVAALRKNRKEEQLMDERGAAVRAFATEFMRAKKAEYLDAKNSLAITNNINAWTLDMRLNEKAYIIDQKQQFINSIKRNIRDLLKGLEQLEKLNPSETEKKQLMNAGNATREYQNAALAWAEELKLDAQSENLKQYVAVMNRAGDTLSQVVEEYALVKQGAVDKTAESVFVVQEVEEMLLNAQLNEKSYRIGRDPVQWESLQKNLEKLTSFYQKLKGLVVSPQDKKRIEEATAATEQYRAAAQSWVQNDNEMAGMTPRMQNNGEQLLIATQKVQKDAGDDFERVRSATQSVVNSSNIAIAAALAIGILVGSLLAFFITRSITRPIQAVIEGLDAGASRVSGAAGRISLAASILAEGTSEQAAAVEETSSSLEEMASMTRKNAENASIANRLMTEASEMVAEANTSFRHLKQSMGDITEAGQETQKIVKTIDEIAFQTNLLALNAAVEAARAGEAGAGFAVVADEVRHLAMRAAEASRNTAGLIESTVKRVSEGSTLLETTEDGFKKVSTGVVKSAELLRDIAAASSEQAQGIDQINRAVAEMDKVIQRNAAGAEESASASAEMNAQAGEMKQYVAGLVGIVGADQALESLEVGRRLRTRASQEPGSPEEPSGEAAQGKVSADRTSRKALASGRRDIREIAPESVIPFEEDY